MIIAFKQRFVSPILNGTKIHTIREDAKNRWQEGMIMHMATGVRTKNYNQFKAATLRQIQQIEIIRTSDYLDDTVVKVDGRILSFDETRQLAYNDGFEHIVEFWLFFKEGFTGKILHWTRLEY